MRGDKYLRAHRPKEHSGWEDNAVRDRRTCHENLCSFFGGVVEYFDYSYARVDIAREGKRFLPTVVSHQLLVSNRPSAIAKLHEGNGITKQRR